MSTKIQVPTVTAEVFDIYKDMARRGGTNHYVVYRHDHEADQIVVEASGDGPFEELVAALPPTDSRWALLNARYTVAGGGKRSKLTLITWVRWRVVDVPVAFLKEVGENG
jgi:hypothetical protein